LRDSSLLNLANSSPPTTVFFLWLHNHTLSIYLISLFFFVTRLALASLVTSLFSLFFAYGSGTLPSELTVARAPRHHLFP
jgi:hypothetical protein